MDSLPGQGWCAVCGKPEASLVGADIWLCSKCENRYFEDIRVTGWKGDPEPLPPEERFEELLRAAQLLTRERVAEADRIYATLAFAAELGRRVPHLVAEKARLLKAHREAGNGIPQGAKASFWRRFKQVIPLEIKSGVLILERVPAFIEVVMYPGTAVPKEVKIEVYRRAKPASPELIAALYEEVLSAGGIAWGTIGPFQEAPSVASRARLSMAVGPKQNYLSTESAQQTPQEPRPPFPPPIWVRAKYQAELSGFGHYLTERERTGDPRPENLIPACVAFYLRTYGHVKGRKEINRLLNAYTALDWKARLPEGSVPPTQIEEGRRQRAREQQVWRDASKPTMVSQPLLALADSLLFPD